MSICSGTLRATFNNSLMATASIFGRLIIIHHVLSRGGTSLEPRVSLLTCVYHNVIVILLRYDVIFGEFLLLRCPFVYICLLRNLLIIAGTSIGKLLPVVILFLGVRGVVYLKRA